MAAHVVKFIERLGVAAINLGECKDPEQRKKVIKSVFTDSQWQTIIQHYQSFTVEKVKSKDPVDDLVSAIMMLDQPMTMVLNVAIFANLFTEREIEDAVADNESLRDVFHKL